MEKENIKPIQYGHAPVNGLQMYYEIYGEGDRPLVLIHGGGSTIFSTFGRIIPILVENYKVVAMELQAHGRTTDRDAPESFEQDADDVAALLEFLAIERANVLGFSNGGSTAMRLAMRHPLLVSKLIVISGLTKRTGIVPGFFEFMQQASLDNMPAPLKEAFLRVNPDPELLQNMHDKDAQRMINFQDWTDEELKAIQAPTLLVSSSKDVILPEHTSMMANLIPNADFIILPGLHGELIGEICSPNPSSPLPTITSTLIDDFLNA